MDLSTRSVESVDQSVVETVEVVAGSESVLSPGGTETGLKIIAPGQLSVPSSGIIEIDPQALSLVQMTAPNFVDVSAVTPLSLATTQSTIATGLPISASSMLTELSVGGKRPLSSDEMLMEGSMQDIPRKKSRNYLDSHKTIEKKRRDRINSGLGALKDLVPDCRQYGSKKLDKAEILEMTIDYIHRLQQNQTNGRSGTTDGSGQREWANEIMGWVFHNKLLYSGANALEQFCNSLLLHLQSYGSSPVTTTTTATGILYNQFPSGGGSTVEEENLRHQNSNLALLQQIAASSGDASSNGQSPSKETPSNAGTSSQLQQQQQAQLAQLQALLLLQQQQQQQQQMFQQQGQHQESGNNSSNSQLETQTQQIQQLQQLHQLQTLLLQHLANEAGSSQKQATPIENLPQGDPASSGNVTSAQTIMVSDAIAGGTSLTADAPQSVELSLSSAITTALEPSPVYTSEENLLAQGTETVSSQMWSQAEHSHHDSPLLLDSGAEGGVQEEVELLEQEHQ